MKIFMKTADPSRKTPVYLQAYTKENFIWQLKVAAVMYFAFHVYEVVEAKRARRDYLKTRKTHDAN